MEAACRSTDIWAWIHSLPLPSQWAQNTMSICICSSNSSIATLTLSMTKDSLMQTISFSILANFGLPISLWISKQIHVSKSSNSPLNESESYNLLLNIIQDVLIKYGPSKQSYPLQLPKVNHPCELKDIFNVSFLTLVFLVCIYEAPIDIRSNCLYSLTDQLISQRSRGYSKMLMWMLGANTEEKWLRCINLAITKWIMELKASNHGLKSPSPLFSHAFSASGLWKVQLYSPVVTMEVENSSSCCDDKLVYSLNYHQLEGVIQLNYKVIVQENWVHVMVSIDNIRLDVIQLVKDNLLKERGVGTKEKHFPSKLSIQLTPTPQTDIISVSVTKSSNNPQIEKESEKNIQGSLAAPYNMGVKLGASETTSTTSHPWKFEESVVIGDSVNLSWFLHDKSNGSEVFSSKPSPMALCKPQSWFKHRYSRANRPFTRQGGVVFARDDYGETVWWKVDKCAIGKTLEWEISGCVGLTYWPNRFGTFYHETRRAEFKETLQLTLG